MSFGCESRRKVSAGKIDFEPVPVFYTFCPRSRGACKDFKAAGAVLSPDFAGCKQYRVKGGTRCKDPCCSVNVALLNYGNPPDQLVSREQRAVRVGVKWTPVSTFAPFDNGQEKIPPITPGFERPVECILPYEHLPHLFTFTGRYPKAPLLGLLQITNHHVAIRATIIHG